MQTRKLRLCGMRSSILSAFRNLALGLTAVAAIRADNYSATVLKDGPLAYYRLNDAIARTNVNVNSGSLGADGNATNLNVHLVPGAIAGSHDKAVYFDTTARTIIPWNAALNPAVNASFTIEGWFYPTSDKVAGSFYGPAPIMNRYSYSGANRQGWVYFQRNPDTTYSADGQSDVGWNFRTYTGRGSNVGIDLTSQVPYRLGEWQHVVTVWDGPSQTAIMYINGAAAATNSYAGSDPQAYAPNTNDHDPAEAVNGAAGLCVGSYNNTQPGENAFRGAADEVAFYGKRLTDTQILAHYQNATNAARATAYDALVKADGPVAYLRLDDPAGGADVAVNSGTLQNAGQASNLNQVKHPAASPLAGTTDSGYAYHWRNNGSATTDIPWTADNNPDATVPFTVEAWFRPLNDQLNPGPAPINNRLAGSAANRSGWVIYQRAPNDTYSGVSGYEGVGWNFRMYNGAGSAHTDVTSYVPYNLGDWQHVVTTWDGASTLTMYVNGVPAITNAAAQYVANINPPAAPDDSLTAADFAVGSYNAASGFGENFEGDIDEVALYNGYALTPDQILAHYQAGTNAHPATNYETLVLTAAYDGAGTQGLQPATYLRLNEPAPFAAVNSGTLGDQADASLVFTTNSVAGPTLPGFDPANLAAPLDGSSNWISLNDPAGLEISGKITLEAWINPAATLGDPARIISHGPPTPSNYTTDQVATNGLVSAPNEVFLRLEGVGANYSVGSYDGTNFHGVTFPVPAGDLGGGQWTYLAGVYDGAKWKLYRNGQLAASATDAIGALPVAGSEWAIGGTGSGWGDLFAGSVDEVAIYNQALTDSQVLAHYQAAASVAEPVLTIANNGASLVVSWPISVAGFTLESNTQLVGGTWQPVGGVSNNSVTIVLDSGQRFYRLRQ